MTFEKYLEDIANDNLKMVLDDDLPDAVSDWIGNLDVQEVIDCAEDWGKLEFLDGKLEGIRECRVIIN